MAESANTTDAGPGNEADGGLVGLADGGGGGSAALKDVVVGAEAALGVEGAVSIYGVWKDKVVYVIFDPSAKTFRVELARTTGGGPKVLLSGIVPGLFENYMIDAGAAERARRKFVPGAAGSDGTFVIAAPSAGGHEELYRIDAKDETIVGFDPLSPGEHVNEIVYRDGYYFYWYSRDVQDHSGVRSLAWRAPTGAVVRVPQSYLKLDTPFALVSPDKTSIAYLAGTPADLDQLQLLDSATLRVARVDGSHSVAIASLSGGGLAGPLVDAAFVGSALVFRIGKSSFLDVWTGAGEPTELFRSAYASSNDGRIRGWWATADAVAVVEDGPTRFVTTLTLAGDRATVAVKEAAVGTDGRVFFTPAGKDLLRAADVAVPLSPVDIAADVREPLVSDDGTFAALRRGPKTQSVVDRAWFKGAVVDLQTAAFDHYDDVFDVRTIASKRAGCIKGMFDTVCVSEAGNVVHDDSAAATGFVRTLGANGLLYESSYQDHKHGGRSAVAVVVGPSLTTTQLSDRVVGELGASDEAVFYLVTTGPKTASLRARPLN
jgi:hypothetical protein